MCLDAWMTCFAVTLASPFQHEESDTQSPLTGLTRKPGCVERYKASYRRDQGHLATCLRAAGQNEALVRNTKSTRELETGDMRTAETHQGDEALPQHTLPQQSVFPFLQLPRELRDQIYDYAFAVQDHHGQRPIERRNLKYFKPSAASILLVIRHDYFLLNRQVAREALEVLFKYHTVFLSSGPFVLKALLERIEEPNGPGRQWLKWLRDIELDWVTFPSLQHYPPENNDWRVDPHWVHDTVDVDVDYIRGAHYNGHYDEYDHEGVHYEDNYYDPSNTSLYPSFHPPTTATAQNANDPFGFATHYPFVDPTRDPVREASVADISSKLDLLVSQEVTPLFAYFASPTFNLRSITLPLAFISRESHYQRSASRPGYALPLKIRYWVQRHRHWPR
ncbi:glucan synthase [Pyrenophora seminiperda CCB06]|uniref:Glucan synthase n=1 Tax=Pyrenophora seminiperda CCB06 TaxID=1302712 RepID=A0A3M7LX89_9PLEO|nr:glucan synthase [Pyrenophora seminiperda CCB06]